MYNFSGHVKYIYIYNRSCIKRLGSTKKEKEKNPQNFQIFFKDRIIMELPHDAQ